MIQPPTQSTPSENPGVVDDVLGVFVRESMELSDGERLDSSFYSLAFSLGGESVDLLLETEDAEVARGLLPRMRRAVEGWEELWGRAVEAVVREFSTQPPDEGELAEAREDLVPQSIVVEEGGELMFHLTDTCGEHLLDGYWPAVRFDEADSVVEVTVES